MANDLTRQPLFIDTASASLISADPFYIKSIRWVAEAALAGNEAIIQDDRSETIWHAVAAGANYTEEVLIENWWHRGFKVTTLEAGALFITYG